ncbi:GNAT family N-acetyltransferase [Rapidithrix thailandica]|uniref:GNAT family N-acetyltransferase n=1 Tax=Rapidithrix thailandica TaxID=413964 RepID=A0AAW9S646_9BACT
MKTEEKKLDNPVWNSLNETHNNFSIEYEGVKFYRPEYCPFGGFTALENASESISKYASLINSFYVVGEKPEYKNELTLNKNLVCQQMILEKPIILDINEQIVELKADIQKKDLFNLVNVVQPGYFNHKTSDLGKYFGIYKNNELVAVTGERMKMNKYTEVSAVVTHPHHTGKGYAKQLIQHTTQHIFNENKLPYLHVAETNVGAIKLYENLGFVNRRKISFWNFVIN